MGSITMTTVLGSLILILTLGSGLWGHVIEPRVDPAKYDPEEECKLPEAVVSLCQNLSYNNIWIPEVRRKKLKRDVGFQNDGSPLKRSFSYTSLPLPARIKFLLKLKNNFCMKQEHQRELCVDRIKKKMRGNF